MGSGLILLVIVLAWLAVLVPMALRSYDVADRFGGADRLGAAVRVLSRRTSRDTAGAADAGADEQPPAAPRARRGTLADRLLGAQDDGFETPRDALPSRAEVRAAARPVAADPVAPVAARRPAPSPARAAALRRRQQLLLALVALAALTLIGVSLGAGALLWPHLALDLLLVGFLVQLRRQAAARARRAPVAARPAAPRRTSAPAADVSRPVEQAVPVVAAAPPARPVAPPAHVAGVPDRMPPRVAPGRVARTAGAAEAPARGAVGAPWSPVPVPVPTYVNAPTAPRPAVASDADLSDAERDLGIVDDGPQLDQILDRRRAVNEW